jgi:hypothetical protein
MSIFKTQKTKYNYLSLGAGVQSSTLAFMCMKGEITPKPDFAVFADTQAEPKEVYDYLSYVKENVDFPVHIVTSGSLEKEAMKIKTAQSDTKNYKEGQEYCVLQIPAFGVLPNGEITAAIGRKCTADYKIKPIHKFVKEEFNINPRKKEFHNTVTQYIGISWDEIQRMKPSRDKWCINRFPLIEKEMKRSDCIKWMKDNGYEEPPRSACYFCPFHDNKEWRNLRNNHPDEFKKAITFDKKIRNTINNFPHMKMEVYLHKDCKPLDEIDFDNEDDKGQMNWFNECEGMCGI